MALSIKNHQNRFPIAKETVSKIAKKILSNYGISRFEICIAFLDNKRIKQLNRDYANRNYPTDVLAFPYQAVSGKGKSILWADIAISVDMAIRNSKHFNTSPGEEICLYIIHGILHLLDFNDNTKVKKLAMEREQQRWLSKLKKEIKRFIKK